MSYCREVVHYIAPGRDGFYLDGIIEVKESPKTPVLVGLHGYHGKLDPTHQQNLLPDENIESVTAESFFNTGTTQPIFCLEHMNEI